MKNLEKVKLKEQFSCDRIVDILRSMRIARLKTSGYIPAYTRTSITDKLHDVSGFRTDYEVITPKRLKEIIVESKKD